MKWHLMLEEVVCVANRVNGSTAGGLRSSGMFIQRAWSDLIARWRYLTGMGDGGVFAVRPDSHPWEHGSMGARFARVRAPGSRHGGLDALRDGRRPQFGPRRFQGGEVNRGSHTSHLTLTPMLFSSLRTQRNSRLLLPPPSQPSRSLHPVQRGLHHRAGEVLR